MITKLFEIRDSMTFIPVLAVAISDADGFLARRAGFGSRCIQLVHFAGGKTSYDPYDWDNRTMQRAHLYIQQFWDDLKDHDVVDVEFILGETKEPKQSEKWVSK